MPPSAPLSPHLLADGSLPRFTARSNIGYVMQHEGGKSFQRDCAADHNQASFIAAVRWDDVGQFFIDMLGAHFNVAGHIQRYDPEPHPFLPRLFCIGLKLQESTGFVSSDPTRPGTLHYDYCFVLCSFSTLPYDVGVSDASVDHDTESNELLRYVEREGEEAGESITVTGTMRFASDNVPVPTPPAIMLPHTKMIYTWYHVPDPIQIFLARARLLYGQVNLTAFDVQKDTFPVGTVLYLGVTKKVRIPGTPTGNIEWMIGQSFMYRAIGWNNAYRPNKMGAGGIYAANTLGWEPVVNATAPGNPPPYASTDLNLLFKLF